MGVEAVVAISDDRLDQDVLFERCREDEPKMCEPCWCDTPETEIMENELNTAGHLAEDIIRKWYKKINGRLSTPKVAKEVATDEGKEVQD